MGFPYISQIKFERNKYNIIRENKQLSKKESLQSFFRKKGEFEYFE